MKPKLIVLNKNQYKNKSLRRGFTSGGFKVIKDKQVKTINAKKLLRKENCGSET